MQLHTTQPYPPFRNAVITIGSFDGIHLGHQQIIKSLLEAANEQQGESVVISFHPHPRTIVQPNALVQNLSTKDEKIELFQQLGVHHLVLYPFTKEFSQLSATAYIEEFIIKQFSPKVVIIGYDHHFGSNREGGFALLKHYTSHFNLVQIPQQTIETSNISSTAIRKALLYGEIEKANTLLGYQYQLAGHVAQGKQIGRTIGFKTANLQVEDTNKLIPGNGVYIADVLYQNQLLQGMMNIGTRPTIDGSHRTIEVHILNFEKEIYGEQLTVRMHTRLRNEQKFDSLKALQQQLEKDKQAAANFFGN
jgi:riboflavin kinase/FMN adenylyltransferase